MRSITRGWWCMMFSASIVCAAPEQPEDGQRTPPRQDGIHAAVDISIGDISGDAGFRIGENGATVSELTYPLEGSVLSLGGAIDCRKEHQAWGYRVSGRYTTDVSVEGTTTDEDFDPWGDTVHFSTSDSDADVRTWELDGTVFCQLSPRSRNNVARSLELGLLLGYGVQSFDFKDSNLVARYYYGTQEIQVDGAVSTYETDFKGARVGVVLSCQPMPGVFLGANYILIPSLEAESDALWILRDYPFQQTADGGGSIFGIRVEWYPVDWLGLHAVLEHVDLTADENGKESGTLDGEAYENESIVDRITAQYDAARLGISVRF